MAFLRQTLTTTVTVAGISAVPAAPISPSVLGLRLLTVRRGRIELELVQPVEQRVRIFLVDVSGRRIATLLDESVPAGHRRVAWEGQGAAALASGLYFLAAEGGGRRVVRRVVLAG